MRVLIAGVGNIFLGDDGFGVEVAAAIGRKPLPPGVEAADYGIRGVHLAYQLLEGYDGLVLVDALDLGEPPGTLTVLEPGELPPPAAVDAHSMDPASVLSSLASLGGRVDRVLVLGCQPGSLEEGIGLSATVAAVVEPAAEEAIRLATTVLTRTEVMP